MIKLKMTKEEAFKKSKSDFFHKHLIKENPSSLKRVPQYWWNDACKDEFGNDDFYNLVYKYDEGLLNKNKFDNTVRKEMDEIIKWKKEIENRKISEISSLEEFGNHLPFESFIDEYDDENNDITRNMIYGYNLSFKNLEEWIGDEMFHDVQKFSKVYDYWKNYLRKESIKSILD